jgi:hypothetical protein
MISGKLRQIMRLATGPDSSKLDFILNKFLFKSPSLLNLPEFSMSFLIELDYKEVGEDSPDYEDYEE